MTSGECPELPVPLSVHYKQKLIIFFIPVTLFTMKTTEEIKACKSASMSISLYPYILLRVLELAKHRPILLVNVWIILIEQTKYKKRNKLYFKNIK